jgi:tetratricopeptide (TPR) repeat protein
MLIEKMRRSPVTPGQKSPRRVLRCVAALSLAAILIGCISEPKRHLEHARILFERRDLKGARLELNEAIKADPDLLEAHKLLARVDEYLGDQQDAALEYAAAARLDPADARLRNKARFYQRKLNGSAASSAQAAPPPTGR